jgi:hypothetical protein
MCDYMHSYIAINLVAARIAQHIHVSNSSRPGYVLPRIGAILEDTSRFEEKKEEEPEEPKEKPTRKRKQAKAPVKKRAKSTR